MRTLLRYTEDIYIMKKLEHFTPYALAILRIIAALLFMQHGLQKLLLFPVPSEHGTPEPWTLVWFGGWIEAAGGALLAVGLFTRAVAFVTAGEMAVAYWMVHAPASFYPVLNHGEPAILFCFVFLLFVFANPGAWSLDGWLLRRKKT
jgi:putative oxidoreductase